MFLSRRDALNAGITGAVAAVLLPHAAAEAAPAPAPNDKELTAGFRLGCQAYSFNRYSAFEAIEKTAQAGGTVIEFFPGQKLRPDSPNGENVGAELNAAGRTALKEKLTGTGVRAVAFGVVGLGRDEAANRRVFEFARDMGIGTLTSEPDTRAMDLIEKLVKEYDIRVAIHNHPRRTNDANYRFWDPSYVLSQVKDRDKRIGSCADTGHWVRSGIKPVDALKVLKGRVLQSHLKDLHVFAPNGHDVPFGTGVSDVPAILKELRAQKFDGNISIEYEYHWETSVPEIAQSIGFVRGWGASTG